VLFETVSAFSFPIMSSFVTSTTLLVISWFVYRFFQISDYIRTSDVTIISEC
jgi:hypothetical protein